MDLVDVGLIGYDVTNRGGGGGGGQNMRIAEESN